MGAADEAREEDGMGCTCEGGRAFGLVSDPDCPRHADPTPDAPERLTDEELAEALERYVELDQSGERLEWLTTGYDITAGEAMKIAARRLRGADRREGSNGPIPLDRGYQGIHPGPGDAPDGSGWYGLVRVTVCEAGCLRFVADRERERERRKKEAGEPYASGAEDGVSRFVEREIEPIADKAPRRLRSTSGEPEDG